MTYKDWDIFNGAVIDASHAPAGVMPLMVQRGSLGLEVTPAAVSEGIQHLPEMMDFQAKIAINASREAPWPGGHRKGHIMRSSES